MNGRKFVGWMLVLVAVCGLAIAGFSAGVVAAACEWGCLSANEFKPDWHEHFHDPYYGIILQLPFDKALEAVAPEEETDGPYCGTSVNVACLWMYDDASFSTPCTYFDELAWIDWQNGGFDDTDFEPESGTFSVPGCNTCT
jgi:hypothetical protein